MQTENETHLILLTYYWFAVRNGFLDQLMSLADVVK